MCGYVGTALFWSTIVLFVRVHSQISTHGSEIEFIIYSILFKLECHSMLCQDFIEERDLEVHYTLKVRL